MMKKKVMNDRPENKSNDEPSFENLGLKENLQRGIYSYGFEKPSKIQIECIPKIISGIDLIAQSQSGTGKTGAFLCGILEIINEKYLYPQAIILTHSRELSIQIESIAKDLGKYMELKTSLCIGGTPVNENIEKVKKSHLVIGTPGRIYDIIKQKAIDMNRLKIFCMDEADQLLSGDFIPQTQKIIQTMKHSTQICTFSATIGNDTLKYMDKFMQNPEEILIKPEKLSLDLIKQYYVMVEYEKNKFATLDDLYKNFSIGQCIIYVNNKEKAEYLKDELKEADHAVVAIHGGLSPLDRSNIMKNFRSGKSRVLVCTDLLARGIDVQQVGYVINYDMPVDPQSYLHRIGRSGRYGKKGIAINFVTFNTQKIIRQLQKWYKISIDVLPPPEYFNHYLSS